LNKLTTSKKVELSLKEQGRNKSWLAKELNISRPALYSKIKDNFWSINEVLKLKSIGLIR